MSDKLTATSVDENTTAVAAETTSAVARALQLASGIPAGATHREGVSAVITSVTPVVVLAAPASGKKLRIRKLLIQNTTAAEKPIITLQTTAGSPVVHAVAAPGDPAVGGNGLLVLDFDPPLKLAVDVGLNAKADSSVGDVYVTALGWEE